VIHFELDNCTNCKGNRWSMEHRQKNSGKVEFKCFACANIVYVRLTEEAYRHLAGDQ
jgi:hypothetical protein